MTEKVLPLFKMDLGITSVKKDEYFTSFILSAESQLNEKGIVLDENKTSDIMLLCDFSSWLYRSRKGTDEMPKNLKLRIRNRIIKRRAEDG